MIPLPVPDPRGMIYAQLRMCLDARRSGNDGTEELSGLMVLIDTLKDDEWREDVHRLTQVASQPVSASIQDHIQFWGTMEAVVRLLKRMKLWVQPGRFIEKGMEFDEAF